MNTNLLAESANVARYPMRVTLIIAVGLLALLSCGGRVTAPVEPDPAGIRVLFIGNSLTYWNEMPEMLRWMLETSEVQVGRIEYVAFPDVGLQDHWASGPARSRIAEGDFDIVVMQQGPSATEGRPSLLEYSQRFSEEIRASGAVPALYMVWPSSARPFDFDGVSSSYSDAADAIDGLLFPAGEAWRAAWAREASLALYGPDGFHPSELGSYLAALVMFEQLAGREASTLPALVPTPSGIVAIPTAQADLLHESATEVNAAFARVVGLSAR